MSSREESEFVETKEYRRFAEFCDACTWYRYIGLCYGPPGVGKTLSARHYANWDKVCSYVPWKETGEACLEDVVGSTRVLYTPQVVNSAGQVETCIASFRHKLKGLLLEKL